MGLTFQGKLTKEENVQTKMDGFIQRFSPPYAMFSFTMTFIACLIYVFTNSPNCASVACSPISIVTQPLIALAIVMFLFLTLLALIIKFLAIVTLTKAQENEAIIELSEEKVTSTNSFGKGGSISGNKICIKKTRLGLMGYAQIKRKTFRIFFLPYRALSTEDVEMILGMYRTVGQFYYANQ